MHAVESYGLWILFFISVLEGPIATVIGGYVSSLGYINIFAVYLVVAADLVGDTILYVFGYFGHHLTLLRWSSKLGFTKDPMTKLERQFQSSGGTLLLAGKLTHAAGFLVLIAAGTSRMHLVKFLGFNLLGTLPKSLLFLVLGYTLGYAYRDIDVYISRISFGILIITVTGCVFYLLRRRRIPD